MNTKYRYDRRPMKRGRRILLVLAIVILIIGLIAAAIVWDLRRSGSHSVDSKGTAISQTVAQNAHLTIDEPYFRFDLPKDWKETGRNNTTTEHSISWQSTLKNEDNRYLTLYIDLIPTNKAVNKLLPLTVESNTLIVGDMSDNCSNFTGGGTMNAQEAAAKLKPTPAKWQQVDFICDLPDVIDNKIGTGSTDGINTVTVNGPIKGKHKYFFIYTDHNIQPNYNIFTDALRSFRAK